jgi:hypothetical protein
MQTAFKLITVSYPVAKIFTLALGAVFRHTAFIMFTKPTKITNGIANRVVADIHFFILQAPADCNETAPC